MAQMMELVASVQMSLGEAVDAAKNQAVRVKKSGKTARAKILELHETMKTLLPQIQRLCVAGETPAVLPRGRLSLFICRNSIRSFAARLARAWSLAYAWVSAGWLAVIC
jgi:hypothetical protein